MRISKGVMVLDDFSYGMMLKDAKYKIDAVIRDKNLTPLTQDYIIVFDGENTNKFILSKIVKDCKVEEGE